MMKNPLRLMIAVGVPIATALLIDQMPKTGVAQVPFAFQVGQQAMPAGTYSIKQADLGRTIRIQNSTVSEVSGECVAAKREFGKARGARLVFDSHGGHYYLSEIWFAADGPGWVLNEKGQPVSSEVRSVRFQ